MSEVSGIPIIDLGLLGLTPAESIWKPEEADPDVVADVAAQIYRALTTVGFMYLKNHGIKQELVNEGHEVAGQFFDLPDDVKAHYSSHLHGEGFFGWTANNEKLDPSSPPDYKEAFDAYPSDKKYWPDKHVPKFRLTAEKLIETNHRLGQVILYLMAVGLGIKDKFYFTKYHDPFNRVSGTNYRFIRYRPIPDDANLPSNTLRCGEHTDWTSVSFLYQDACGGLEVKNKLTNTYSPATPIEGTVVVNVGDTMQRWSADVFVSTLHRVVMPGADNPSRHKTRLVQAFFYHPDDDHSLTCADGSNKYEPITAWEYGNMKSKETY